MPRCIYCTVEKDEDGFNRDHVIPEAFGLFDGNFVLTCVCVACNQFFGDTLELKLARDSLEGHDRVRVGLKDATDFRSLGKRSTTYVEFDGDSAVAGARGYLLAPKEGPELATTVMPRVGFRRDPGGPFEWFPIDRLPNQEELLARGYRRGEPLHMQTQGEASIEEFRAALSTRGLTFTVDSEIAPLRGRVHAEVVFKVDRPEFRAHTKIALNYLAAVAGPEVALLPCFDQARRFVRYDEGSNPVAPPRRARPHPSGCHYLSVQNVGDKVVAHLSLLMRVAYYTITLAPEGFSLPLASAHFFNTDTRDVTPTLVLPTNLED